MGFGNLVVNGCQSSVVGLINRNCMKFVFVMILSMEKQGRIILLSHLEVKVKMRLL